MALMERQGCKGYPVKVEEKEKGPRNESLTF
jgi:hypothetical protein